MNFLWICCKFCAHKTFTRSKILPLLFNTISWNTHENLIALNGWSLYFSQLQTTQIASKYETYSTQQYWDALTSPNTTLCFPSSTGNLIKMNPSHSRLLIEQRFRVLSHKHAMHHLYRKHEATSAKLEKLKWYFALHSNCICI